MNIKNKKLLVITGLSGAGMSSALKNIEDLNYEVFDNFPLTLVEPLLLDSHRTDYPIAIGIDTRTRGFSSEAVVDVVGQFGATLLFITADDSILQKRFTETRRRHPMAKDRSVGDGIKKERNLLYSLENKADLIIDTSSLSIHELRRILEGHFKKENQDKLTVTLLSFGFRWGLPREADIVMDVRFLQNPYWIKELQSLNGNDSAVGTYI
nr:RNase adaptor protein RapZ [Betaproteobacteria bacterium]